jgi:hypothetical protein
MRNLEPADRPARRSTILGAALVGTLSAGSRVIYPPAQLLDPLEWNTHPSIPARNYRGSVPSPMICTYGT